MSLPEPREDALRYAEAFAGVGVVRADFDARELRDGDVLGGVVEEDEVDGVAGVLGADEVGERHRYAFGGGEAVFAVEDHGVRAVEQDYRGAGGLVVGLLDVEVGVLEVEDVPSPSRVRPSRAKTLLRVAVMSRLRESPNS